MKKEITVAIAALGFISSAVGVYAYSSDDPYIFGTAGEKPLVINLENQFDKNIIDTQKIKKITFSVDCKTNLDGERAYCNQGIMWYYSNGELDKRSFADIVSVNDAEYELVKHQDSVCTEFVVGTDKNPLNADLDKDIKFEWTWITSEKLSMYSLEVQTMDGKVYPLAIDDDYYTIEIAEKMREDKPQERVSDEYGFPFKGRYCVTSVYGWDNDRYHDALDMFSYTNDDVYSVCDGTVYFADWENPWDHSQGYGKFVKVEADDGTHRFFYGHLDEINVVEGQHVSKWEKLGVEGGTGVAQGAVHLDISCHKYDPDYGWIEDNIAEVLGVTNDYGDYAAIIEDDTIPDDTELLIKMVSLNKHFEISNYLGFKNALNPDDNGAMSGGILQWRGANYRDMLQYVYNTNPDEYKSIANKYTGNLAQIVDYSSSWWQKHTIKTTDSEYRFYQELFSTDWASEAQWNYAIEYERKVLEDARSHGVTDEKTIILFSRLYNYHSYAGATQQIRDNGVNDFSTACNLARADEYFLCPEDTITLIANESYEICSLESIRKENP